MSVSVHGKPAFFIYPWLKVFNTSFLKKCKEEKKNIHIKTPFNHLHVLGSWHEMWKE